MRTLIVAPPSVGEAVMTQPLVALLARLDPGGRVDVLADAGVAPVFGAMPGVASVIGSPALHGAPRPWALARLARRLAAMGHDRAFVLPASRRGALLPWLARIPLRVGARRDTRWGLINQPHDGALSATAAGARPPVERFALLAFDASQPPPGRMPDPVLARDARREAVALDRAGLAPGARVLALCVGTDGARSRRWPARHWASLLALAAAERPELEPVLLGDAVDRTFATEVAALSGRAVRNLCGALPLADAIALLSRAEAVAAHDCGLMHVAAAFGRPMVAVFGPTDPRFAPPRTPRARIEWLAAPCSPCGARTCPLGHGRCLGDVRPEAVFDALRATLRFAAGDIR